MITCFFEHDKPGALGKKVFLRHVVTNAIVEKDGCLLLVKRAPGLLESNKWAFPGGFLDRDETIGAGVLRELLEETGWKGEIISLFRINSTPDRPCDAGRQNVVLEYLIRPTKQISKPDKESTEVSWISFEALPRPEEIAFDHGKTIDLYKEYRLKSFPLPLIV